MPILYALVARDQTVLAEYAAVQGNFVSVSRRILEKLQPNASENRRSYTYDRHVFHYLFSDGVTFLCMADDKFPRRAAFAFLEDIKNRFIANYRNQIRTAMPFAMNQEFSRVMSRQMDFYSHDPSSDKISNVKQQIDETKQIMVQNIDTILERGERLELLVSKTESLSEHSRAFHTSSRKLKYALCWKNVKLWFAIIIMAIILLWLIISLACGFTFSKCRKK